MEFTPRVSVQSLFGSPPGALVFFEGAYSFVCTSANDPKETRMLAEVDTVAGQIAYRYFDSDQEVLFVGNDFVVEPRFGDGAVIEAPAGDSGTRLFFDGTNVLFVVRLDGDRDWRVLNLNDGIIRSGNGARMASFGHWRVTVRGAWGAPVSLMEI